MTSCTAVVDAFETMRDEVGALAGRTPDKVRRSILSSRAAQAGSLAETCNERFAGRDVPDGSRAVQDAAYATGLAKSARPVNTGDLKRVATASGRANTTLNGIMQAGRTSTFSKRLDVLLGRLPGLQSPSGSSDEAKAHGPSPLVTAAIVAATLVLVALPLLLDRGMAHTDGGHTHD